MSKKDKKIPSENFVYDDNYITTSEARDNMKYIVDRVTDSSIPLHVTRNGKPVAVLVGYNLWKQTNKKLEQLYTKTFIDPKFSENYQTFTNEEIEKWMEEDKL